MPRDVGVILVAAGQGTRVGGGGPPKQFRQLAGVPVVLRALRPFAAHREVAQVVLVVPPADAAEPPPFLRSIVGAGLRLVAGGAERGDSVQAGLAALEPVCSLVLVHDAARPFVKPDVIDAVIQEARAGAGAVAAVPVTDTVKELAGGGHRVLRTLPRDRLWRAQTPQGFPRALLTEAYARARQEGVKASDDAALVERLGATVIVVPDSPGNVKITTAEDLAWAEAWVASRG